MCPLEEVSADRTNLSPFTKDFRALAFVIRLTLVWSPEGPIKSTTAADTVSHFTILPSPHDPHLTLTALGFVPSMSFLSWFHNGLVCFGTFYFSSPLVELFLHRWQYASAWSVNWCCMIASWKLKPITHPEAGSSQFLGNNCGRVAPGKINADMTQKCARGRKRSKFQFFFFTRWVQNRSKTEFWTTNLTKIIFCLTKKSSLRIYEETIHNNKNPSCAIEYLCVFFFLREVIFLRRP